MFDLIQKLLGRKVNWDGTDRRRFVRSRCNFELSVDKLGAQVRVRDLGQNGLRLDCSSQYGPKLKAGTLIGLRLGQPDASPVPARVCWIRNSAEVSRLGLKFVGSLKNTWMQELIDRVAGQPRQKRRSIRVKTDWTVQAYHGHLQLEARLRDLSVTGCRFETRDSVLVGQELRLKMGTIEVTAEVRRVSGDRGLNLVGVKFSTQEPQTQQLVDLLRKLTGG
jgi:hypothetical protein